MTEIERKYLIGNLDILRPLLVSGKAIKQGYLFATSEKSCRIRIKGDRGFLTIKIGESALVRSEYEYEIPINDAESLLQTCPRVLSKCRYELPVEGHTWEIDVFEGKLEGLVVAEIELTDVDERFLLPPWVGEEVTSDPSYLNVNLINRL
jgi:CYTH domain-containing protein